MSEMKTHPDNSPSVPEPAADWFELALRTLAVLGAVAVIALAITVAWVGVPAEVTP